MPCTSKSIENYEHHFMMSVDGDDDGSKDSDRARLNSYHTRTYACLLACSHACMQIIAKQMPQIYLCVNKYNDRVRFS